MIDLRLQSSLSFPKDNPVLPDVLAPISSISRVSFTKTTRENQEKSAYLISLSTQASLDSRLLSLLEYLGPTESHQTTLGWFKLSPSQQFLADQGQQLPAHLEEDSWLQWFFRSEPSSQLLICYSSAESSLIDAMMQGKNPLAALNTWRQDSEVMLRFCRHNRQRTALVDTRQALAQPELFLQACQSFLKLSGSYRSESSSETDLQVPDIYRLIAQQMLSQDPDASALQAELEARSLSLAEYDTNSIKPLGILRDYQASQALLEQLSQRNQYLQDQYKDLGQQHREIQAQLEQAQAEHDSNLNELQNQMEAQQETLRKLEQETRQLSTENLEKSTAISTIQQSLEETRAAEDRLKKEITELKVALAEVEKQHSDVQDQRQEAQNQVHELIEENGLLLTELKRFQNEQEEQQERTRQLQEKLQKLQAEKQQLSQQQDKEAAELKKQCADLQKINEQLSKDKVEFEKQFADTQKTNEQLSKDKAQLDKHFAEIQKQLQDSKSLEEENELLLLQLHQVQEELETTFLNAQANEKYLKEVQSQLKQSQEQAQEQNNIISEQKHLLTELRAKKAELTDIRKQLSKENTQLRQQLETSSRPEELEQQIQQLQQDKQLLEQQVSEIAEQKSILAESLEGFQQPEDVSISELRAQLQQFQEEHHNQQQTLRQQQKLIHEQRQLLSELRAKKAELADIRKQLSKENTQLRQQLGIQPQIIETSALPNTTHLAVSYETSSEANDFPLDDYQALLEGSPLFDADYYLDSYPDVAESGINPALHYLLFGAREERNPSLHFNTKSYLLQYPELVDSNINPLIHHLHSSQIKETSKP